MSKPNAESVSVNALFRKPGALQVSKGPEDAQTVLVELERLEPCRYQGRQITPDRARQLAETIRQNGLLQPVTARQVGETLELIAGHRRREAFRLLFSEATTEEERAKWSRIPCIVRLGLSEVQVASLAATENMERDDGTELEQGLSLLAVKKVGAFATNAQVAAETGLNVQRVTRLIRLAESPDCIQKAVSPGVLVELPEEDGKVRREHRRLELTVALAAGPFLRHHERTADRETALDRTERLLQRAAKGRWTRARLEAEVKKATAGATTAEGDSGHDAADDAESSAPAERPEVAEVITTGSRRQLFRHRGDQWVLYLRNLERAAPVELRELLGRLQGFATEVERRLADPGPSTAPNHQ